MSITSPLTLDDVAGNAKTFQRLSTVADSSKWIRTDTTAAEPIHLTIGHNVQGSGTNAADRHLVRLVATKLDGAGIPRTVVINTTITRPRSSAISDTFVKDLVAHLVAVLTDNQLTSGFVASTNLNDLFIGVM